MDVAYIGFGSNLGDREQYIVSALRLLAQTSSLDFLKMSSLYETEPTDGVGGTWFLNGVAAFTSFLQPVPLLNVLRSVEVQLGRQNAHRSGPRTIDLDLLLFGDCIISEPDLTIPHPKMARRSFVLVPLLEIDPLAFHPVMKKHLRDVLADIHKPSHVRLYKKIGLGKKFSWTTPHDEQTSHDQHRY